MDFCPEKTFALCKGFRSQQQVSNVNTTWETIYKIEM